MTTDPRDWHLRKGQNLMAGDVLLPRLIVKQSALEHNIERLAHYCREHGVSLAPHAKTTMAPGILSRQLAAGVWGFTVATVTQAQTLRRLGVERILIANEVVEQRAIEWIAAEMANSSGCEIFLLVDSLRGVSILDATLKSCRNETRLGVLIELGESGGRAGCRTDEEAIVVAAAVRNSRHLKLAGLEGFEALLAQAAVRPFLRRVRGLATRLIQEQYVDSETEVLVSIGSSELIEPTVEELSGWALGHPVRTLLRPGGYATNSPIRGYRRPLEIWSAVLSRPESNIAIASFGRRDVPSDETLLTPVVAVSQGKGRDIAGRATIRRLYDQHAVVELNDTEIEVGEFLNCSVVSPYRPAFATWRTVPMVDEDYRIVEVLDVLY